MCRWGHESHSQWMGSLSLHDALRCLHEREPDDDCKDGDRVDGNRQVVERHHNRGQGTQRGNGDGDDNSREECRLSLNFECKFHAQKCGEGGNCIKNCKDCAGEVRLRERKEPGTMQPTK